MHMQILHFVLDLSPKDASPVLVDMSLVLICDLHQVVGNIPPPPSPLALALPHSSLALFAGLLCPIKSLVWLMFDCFSTTLTMTHSHSLAHYIARPGFVHDILVWQCVSGVDVLLPVYRGAGRKHVVGYSAGFYIDSIYFSQHAQDLLRPYIFRWFGDRGTKLLLLI